MCQGLFVIKNTDFTLAFCYKEEMKCFRILLNNNVIRLFQMWNYIFNQIINQDLIIAEDEISIKSIYENMLHHQTFETGREHIDELVHFLLVIQSILGCEHELSYFSLDVFW